MYDKKLNMLAYFFFIKKYLFITNLREKKERKKAFPKNSL